VQPAAEHGLRFVQMTGPNPPTEKQEKQNE